MNELERATTALVDRPVAAPAPVEVIERRAGTIRRRRRLLEVSGIALAVLLLGAAGLALSAARSDDGQGVFVGEGPSTPPAPGVVTYRLGAPIDDATAAALKQTIEARFRWFGQGDAGVLVSGTEVTVTTNASADRVDALVTSLGGFQLRAMLREDVAAACDSGGGSDAEFLWTSAQTGPPRCIALQPAIELPFEPSTESGSSLASDGTYQTDIALTPEASQDLLSSQGCVAGPCGFATLALTTAGGILHPDVQVTSKDGSDGPQVRIAIPGFSDSAVAQLWASVLIYPLPDGVELTRAASDSSGSTAPDVGQSTGTTAVGGAEQPLSADVSSVFCLRSPVDGPTLEATAAVLEARFAAIGQTVAVTPVQNQHGQTASCLSFRTELDSAHPIYSKDVIANFQPSELHVRQDAWEEVLGVTTRTATMLAPDSGMLVVSIGPDDYAALTSHHPKVCPPNADCNWLNATVQLGAGSGTAWLEVLEPGSMTLRLDSAADALRWKATIEHPLPAGVVFN